MNETDSDATEPGDGTLCTGVVTIASDRSLAADDAGEAIGEALEDDGNEVVVREHVGSDYDRVQSIVSRLIDRDDVEIVITAGATGVEPADITIEAVDPLLERRNWPRSASCSPCWPTSRSVRKPSPRGPSPASPRDAGLLSPGNPDAARLALAEIILPEATGIVELAREPEPESEGEADTEEDPDTENEAGTGEESETADETVDTGVPNEATDGGPDVGSGDRDGGGTGSDAIDKATVRERIWDDLEESGEARFPSRPTAGFRTSPGRATLQTGWPSNRSGRRRRRSRPIPTRRSCP